ncbi:MAG: DUF1192 domain-containing protein [Pseudomonadota bacterium]|jgi:uncharacterized small protein (DUF1192 family)|nr:DUF1192 domain-containing protein [Pseudomonadota bacterium]
MMEEPAAPRTARGAALIEATREDLELYAVGDLEDRIDRLQDEIGRTRAALDKKRNGRAAADALFSFGSG